MDKTHDKQLISDVVDGLYQKLSEGGAFKHDQPSQKTQEMFKNLEKKIEYISADVHEEIGKLLDKIDAKAPKSWLTWQWTLLGLLATIMTLLMGAQYGETKKLNENITGILIEQAKMQVQIEATTKSISNLERNLELAE